MFDTISTDLEGISNNAHKSRFLIAAGIQAHFVSSFKSVQGLKAIPETHAINLSPFLGPHNPQMSVSDVKPTGRGIR